MLMRSFSISQVSAVPRFNGGVYYLERGETCTQVYDTARALLPLYGEIGFELLRGAPNEELLVSLAMALHGQKPVAEDGTIMNSILAGPGGVVDGRIIALDILPMEPVAGVEFIQGDFREDDILKQLEERVGAQAVDLVISDMAPNLSGVGSADSARIQHVCELALEFACAHLKPNGALIVKAL